MAGIEQGCEEGLEKGREEGRYELIKRLLHKHSVVTVSELFEIELAEVQAVYEQILTERD